MHSHITWLTLDPEEISEEIDGWADAKKCFIDMHKDGYGKHSVGVRWFIVNPKKYSRYRKNLEVGKASPLYK